jgi:hypothetical protein
MKDIYKQYPELENAIEQVEVLCKLTLEKLNELDEKFPVEGSFWIFDPNDMRVTLLREQTETEKEDDKIRLQRQIKCVEGKHEWTVINQGSVYGVQWCKYCGAIKFVGGVVCPDHPHFLEKQRKKGE